MQHLSADEIASVLIARLMREVQHFVANSVIQEGARADEIAGALRKPIDIPIDRSRAFGMAKIATASEPRSAAAPGRV